jgi:DHA1 family tetracycline resistance protein-like MFS transporter
LKTRSLWIACAIVFIDMIGLGLVTPVMPGLIVELSGFSLGNAATVAGYLLLIYALMLFLASPLMGAFSDRFGRRPVIVLCMTGLTIDYLIMTVTGSLVILFVGRALAGLLGATYSVANAVVADVENPEGRAKTFGLVAAAGGIGFICGPAIGGMIAGLSLRAPFILAAGLCGVMAITAWFAFPETNQERGQQRFDWRSANPFGSFISLGKYPEIHRVLTAMFFFQLAFQAIATLWAFFGIAQFNWEPTAIGLSIAFYGLLVAIIQGAVVGAVIARIGEGRTAICGVFAAIIGYAGFAVVTCEAVLYGLIVLSALSGLTFPAIQSIMSRGVPEHRQGELQGAVASVVSLSSIIGPLVTSQIFVIATSPPHVWPGAPFLLSAFLCGVTLLLLAKGWTIRPPIIKSTS